MALDVGERDPRPPVSDGGVDPAAVAAHLRRLDRTALADLVAALWAARGFDVEQSGDRLLARRGDRELVLWCGWPDDAVGERSVDRIVAPGAPAERADEPGVDGARVLDATDLADVLLYAVDRPTARELCDRHLGAPPGTLDLPRQARLRRRATGIREAVGPPSRIGIVMLVVLLAVGLGGLVPVELLAGDTGDDALAHGGAGVATSTATAPEAAGAYPPGVGQDGIEDVEALAAAHRLAYANASYSVWIDLYRPWRSTLRERRVRHDVRARVDGREYLVDWTVDTQETTEQVLSVYRDPSGRFVAEDTIDGTVYRRAARRPETPVPEPFSLRTVIVSRYLSTPESELVSRFTEDGHAQYRIDGRGTPSSPALANATDYEVIAVVDERGFVRKLVADYTVLTAGGSYDVRLRVRYGRIGATSVDRPTWVNRINATASPSGRLVDTVAGR